MGKLHEKQSLSYHSFLHEDYSIDKCDLSLYPFNLNRISDMEAATFFEKFSSDYHDKSKLVKILLCPSMEKLKMYLPKKMTSQNLHITMTNYWKYFVSNFWKGDFNVKLDAIEKIFIVFEANTGIKTTRRSKESIQRNLRKS